MISTSLRTEHDIADRFVILKIYDLNDKISVHKSNWENPIEMWHLMVENFLTGISVLSCPSDIWRRLEFRSYSKDHKKFDLPKIQAFNFFLASVRWHKASVRWHKAITAGTKDNLQLEQLLLQKVKEISAIDSSKKFSL